ncbi:uncharacterized protein LOC62_07G009682 [Vanrija pseudolonga]|uniref:Uncharacterized protein n=1 Tax=Vanrija pseudolonga TaxID=143232 RepID=A0AAF0YK63_9TREE|nr:hypothetical protein LOC62_07G009682 [Vanrija pseudolonga]
MVLISPARINDLLTSLLDNDAGAGPHTALLITPQGQLLSHVTLSYDDDGDEGAEEEEEDAEFTDAEANGDAADGDTEDDTEEPWLEGPERLRLLLGLASQWEEDESPRVECELGRLFLRPIPLPDAERAPETGMPVVRPPHVSSFVLVLNGTSSTPWTALAQKADTFVTEW